MAVMLRWYREILEMFVKMALTPTVSRAIYRKSEFRPGGVSTVDEEEVAEDYWPTGGLPGDVLTMIYSRFQQWFYPPYYPQSMRYITPRWLYDKRRRKVIENDPDFYEGKNKTFVYTDRFAGLTTARAGVSDTFGGVPIDYTFGHAPVILHRLALRNARYDEGLLTLQSAPPPNNARPARLDYSNAAWLGESRTEWVKWTDVPAGTYYWPYNVPWFVARRDLTHRSGMIVGRKMKLRTQVVSGSPPADLVLRYQPIGGGSWSDLMRLNLQPGGPRSTGWMDMREDLGDVRLAFFVDVRSATTIDLGVCEALCAWRRRSKSALRPYDEFD